MSECASAECARAAYLVDTDDKHGRVVGGGRDDDLLGAALEVGLSLSLLGEHAGGLDDVVSAGVLPGDLSGVLLGVERDGVAVDDELAVLLADLALEAAVGRVVLEHVNLRERRT